MVIKLHNVKKQALIRIIKKYMFHISASNIRVIKADDILLSTVCFI